MSQDDPQPTSSGAPDDEPSIGERLRTAREAQPLTLAQIAAELRIELDYLKALEDDRLDEFPAPVFAKGYLKQYGGLLGLDHRDLLAQYYRQVDVQEAPVVRVKPIRLRDENQIRHWVAAGVVLALLIGGFIAWWLSRPELEPVPVERLEEALTEPPQILTPVEMLAPATVPSPAFVGDSETEPVLVGPTVQQSGAEPTAAAQPAAVTEDPMPGTSVQVEVSFIEDCWTEISDARGERLFYGLGSAGARSRFAARLPISVFFGNASGVELTVDGQSYPVPAGSRQGNLARFVIADPGI